MIIGGYLTPFMIKYYGYTELFAVYCIIVTIATVLMYIAKFFKENEDKKMTATTINAKTDIKNDDKKINYTNKNGVKNIL